MALVYCCSLDGLIASIVLLICTSLWIKASAKWLNVNVMGILCSISIRSLYIAMGNTLSSNTTEALLNHASETGQWRSHCRRQERQSGRKSFIFNVSRRRAPARAAHFGRWEHRGELKSSQLYGNELWCGLVVTNRNVEVLRLRGFQRTQSCKLWFRPH